MIRPTIKEVKTGLKSIIICTLFVQFEVENRTFSNYLPLHWITLKNNKNRVFHGTHVSPARAISENWQRGITPKILMSELWILCMTLDPLYPHMKFHFNSINWTQAIWKIKSVTGKVWRTDRRTDRQTTEKWFQSVCNLCLQEVTQKRIHGINLKVGKCYAVSPFTCAVR